MQIFKARIEQLRLKELKRAAGEGETESQVEISKERVCVCMCVNSLGVFYLPTYLPTSPAIRLTVD